MQNVRLEHRKIGSQHVFTSPDMPGLYVAHADYETARAGVPSAIEMLERMKERRAQRKRVERRIANA